MPVSGLNLKLTMASPFSINSCKLVRHIPTATTPPPPLTPTRTNCTRKTLCAYFPPAAHVISLPGYNRNPPFLFTMFRGRKTRFSSSTPTPSPPLNKAGFPGSNLNPNHPSGSGAVADMDPDNDKTVHGGDWYGKPTPSPSLHQRQQQQPPSSKLLTLPTILTLGRVAAVPLLIGTFHVDSWWGRTATTSIFIVAAITDWLDGYLARKMRLGSTFGAFLDPVADKLMVAATLVLLCTRPLEISAFGEVPWLLPVPAIVIIGREITMSAVREWAASQNVKLLEAVAVNKLGKWKTATQMIALTILLATRDSSLGEPLYLVGSGVALLYLSAGLSLWSLAVYMGKISKVLLK
ncbi:CDP-diacylglycerol--glycerol-3-phosphate 3-phosphatidyltransferase 1, chloroplastic-like isoform X1 [Mangifera indica]|uniref:CDP-diacylglycerol--glycerol-3-phosphate 3-phosphatidyltransferase 1, chloroplastic-like isoform X1 n=1 Tax=Mangifera indica TaxID=29780 RepID=UPI001CFA5BFF|nr:CDP-diacylglycerol--glycerol-3-phosphate 3-phosphatidyltransferase 1, chloroplastic-like isoform X1 [Mangifera indica]